nr:MAG TPA: hypothetical protein [Bacteriophage sp.]
MIRFLQKRQAPALIKIAALQLFFSVSACSAGRRILIKRPRAVLGADGL